LTGALKSQTLSPGPDVVHLLLWIRVPVRRQLSIALMLCLGLIWAASPALACARMAHRDCCPTDSSSPCEGEKSRDLGALTALCCVTAPAAATSVAADLPRAAHLQDTGSPDPVVLLAWFATFSPRDYSQPPAPPHPLVAPPDGSLTYLRTLRLRL
jgi:hypothetical protein